MSTKKRPQTLLVPVPRDIDERRIRVQAAWDQFRCTVDAINDDTHGDECPIVFVVWNICPGEGEVIRQARFDLLGPDPGLVWVEASQQIGIGIPI